jgi:hypothetical protein
MQYKVVYDSSPSGLSGKVSEMVNLGWQPIGSHQVVVLREQNRYSGQQHMDTLNSLEYSQSMVKETNKNVIEVDIAFYHPDDDETKKVYDIEGMLEEFEHKLNKIIKGTEI